MDSFGRTGQIRVGAIFFPKAEKLTLPKAATKSWRHAVALSAWGLDVL